MRKRRAAVVGLDIQASELAAAEVADAKGRVKRVAVSPLPPGLFSEGEIDDVEKLAVELKSFFRAHKLNRRVRLGMANQRVVVRVIALPDIKEKDELDAAVRFQASELLPMPPEETVLDYQVADRITDNAGTKKQRVVVVAAPREMVEGSLAMARKAGLKLEGIDLSAFALIRALYGSVPQDLPAGPGEELPEGSGEKVPEGSGEKASNGSGDKEDSKPSVATVYCHLGTVTNLAVAQGQVCLFARALPYGVEVMAEDLARKREIAIGDARRWLTYVGLKKSLEGIKGDPELIKETREVLEEGCQRLAGDLQVSLDYYGSQPDAFGIRQIMLTGPGIAIEGLVDGLGDHLPAPAAAAAPTIEGIDGIPPAHLAVAFGLALDEVVT